VYTIRFTKNSNPIVYDSFWRAIESLRQEIGSNHRQLVLAALQDRHGAQLLKDRAINNGDEWEYIFQFPDEKTYALFLLRV